MTDLKTWRAAISAGLDRLESARSLSVDDLEEEQRQGARSLCLDSLPVESVDTIAGVDVQYADDGQAYAAAIVLDRESLQEKERSFANAYAGQSYEFGFLGYRELPAILAALAGLSVLPDVIFYDGNGTLHPRGFGAASQLGVTLDHPVIGVSKNVSAHRPFTEKQRGETRILDQGNGALLMTRNETNPVCVSPGHRVDLSSSLALVLAVSRSRLPEPVKIADRAAREQCRLAQMMNFKGGGR